MAELQGINDTAPGMDDRGQEAEVRAEVLHHPDHEPKHFRVSLHATLLELLDHAANKLDVKLLPDPPAPLDLLRGVYPHHRVGEPLDLSITVGDFLSGEDKTHDFAIELVLAIEINTRWRVATAKEMNPKALLALAGLSSEEYSLYYPVESVEPLPPDTPVNRRVSARQGIVESTTGTRSTRSVSASSASSYSDTPVPARRGGAPSARTTPRVTIGAWPRCVPDPLSTA